MDLNNLLMRAQRLNINSQTQSQPFIQPIQPIQQLLKNVEKLHARVMTNGLQDMGAALFFASKGIDVTKMSEKLESITFDISYPDADPDVEGFLKNQREDAILAVIDDVNKNASAAAEMKKWKLMHAQWQDDKIKILDTLSDKSKYQETNCGEQSIFGHIEKEYAREISDYNLEVVKKGKGQATLAQRCSKLTENLKIDMLTEIWQIVQYMVDMAPMYAKGDQMQLIDGAAKYLESGYKKYISSEIKSNLRDAQRGGLPNNYNLIASFVGLKMKQSKCLEINKDLIENKSLWTMIYYFLRCGQVKSALQCIETCSGEHEALQRVLHELVNRPENKIDPELEHQLKLLYKNQIKTSMDPYQKAVYCAISDCDRDELHAQVATTIDDYIWIKLSALRNSHDISGVLTSYTALQMKILEKYGEKHFKADEQPIRYIRILALTGQFESAIEFLARNAKYRTHAVHIALALAEVHLIHVPSSIQALLLSVDIADPAPKRRLNIARLVMIYVQNFELTNTEEALQYYFFLRKLKDQRGYNVFLVCLCDLVISCGNYSMFFGKMKLNGSVCSGLLDKFNCVEFDKFTAAGFVAQEMVEKGMYEESINLFDIANMGSKSLYYLSQLLSRVVHLESEEDSLRARLIVMADDFRKRIEGSRLTCDSKTLTNFNTLYELVFFFDYYHEDKWELALEVLANMKLVPLSVNQLETCLKNFTSLDVEIRKVYSEILFATMDILHTLYEDAKNHDICSENTCQEVQLKMLRDKARAITTMVGTMPYQMPGDMYNSLVEMEISMH